MGAIKATSSFRAAEHWGPRQQLLVFYKWRSAAAQGETATPCCHRNIPVSVPHWRTSQPKQKTARLSPLALWYSQSIQSLIVWMWAKTSHQAELCKSSSCLDGRLPAHQTVFKAQLWQTYGCTHCWFKTNLVLTGLINHTHCIHPRRPPPPPIVMDTQLCGRNRRPRVSLTHVAAAIQF